MGHFTFTPQATPLETFHTFQAYQNFQNNENFEKNQTFQNIDPPSPLLAAC